MSLLATRRSRLAASATAAVLVVGASLAVSVPAAQAAVNYGVTITTVSPTKVAASLGNRVIIINGTNFDEDQITGITLGADADCANLQSYVVTSSTQISVKTPSTAGTTPAAPGTPAAGCVVSPNNAAEDVTIIQTESGTVTKTAALTFVPPPSLDELVTTAGSENFPLYTDNSSALDMADRVRSLTAAGSQVVRIKAGPDFAFDGRGTAGLTGTLGGKALTTVGFLASDGSAQGTTAAPTGNGNFWLARTGTALSTTSPTLVVTQGTVNRTFTATAAGFTVVNAPTITALEPSSGKTGAATTVRITGTNLLPGTDTLSVTFCGVAGTVLTTPAATATGISVTTPNGATALAALKTALGGTSGVCPVILTRTPTTGTAVSTPITAASAFAFLDR